MKNPSKWAAGTVVVAVVLGVTASAMAAPYSVTYTDTVAATSPAPPAGIIIGEQVVVKVIFDNGNSSVASQAWSPDDVQCVIFTFNNAQNKFVAISYPSPGSFSTAVGSFTTDGSGQLQAGSIEWDHYEAGGISNPVNTNISGVTLEAWYLNGDPDVVYWIDPSRRVNFTNVANVDQVTNWSNPVPSDGSCGPAAKAAAPLLGTWSMVLLASLLGLGGILTLCRQTSVSPAARP